MPLFPIRVFCTIAVPSSYGEYVVCFPLPDGVFSPCQHGLNFFTILEHRFRRGKILSTQQEKFNLRLFVETTPQKRAQQIKPNSVSRNRDALGPGTVA